MNFDFIGKIDGLNNEKRLKRIRWLYVGLVCSGFLAFIGVIAKRAHNIAMLVPFFTFLSSIKSAKGRLTYVNCGITISVNDSITTIKAHNCFAIDENVCSYIIEAKHRAMHPKYIKRKETLTIKGKMSEYYVDSEGNKLTDEHKVKRINIYTDKNNASNIIDMITKK